MVMTNSVKEYSSVPQRNLPMTTGQTLNAQRKIGHGPLSRTGRIALASQTLVVAVVTMTKRHYGGAFSNS